MKASIHQRINSYYAILVITVIGAVASITLMRVADTTNYAIIASNPVYVELRN